MQIKSFYRALRRANKKVTSWKVDDRGNLRARMDGVYYDVCPINVVYNARYNGDYGSIGFTTAAKKLRLSDDDMSMLVGAADNDQQYLTPRLRKVRAALLRAANQ